MGIGGVVLGVVYFVYMMVGTTIMRVPPKGCA